MIVITVSFSRGHFKRELLEGSGTSDVSVSMLRSVADIHVPYSRIDSSRLRALTTRLSGSLVAECTKMLATRHDSTGSSTTRSNTCRLDSMKVHWK